VAAPADLFLQPGDQPPVVTENLGDAMCEAYRTAGIFAHEDPVRQVVERIANLHIDWVHAMHGGSLTRAALPGYISALRRNEFAYRGVLPGRELWTGVATDRACPIGPTPASSTP